jgi:hypothetical protein
MIPAHCHPEQSRDPYDAGLPPARKDFREAWGQFSIPLAAKQNHLRHERRYHR